MQQYNELYHHGVKGTRWGVQRAAAQINKKYNQSRLRSHEQDIKWYKEKAGKKRFKSWANPLYTLNSGLAKGHEERAKYHAYGVSFCDSFFAFLASLHVLSQATRFL